MKDRIPATGEEGRMLITPENGDPPFYAIVTMADNPSEEGTPLNKATLLQDQTAARYGKGNNAVPDTIFDQIAEELDRYAFAQAGGVKIERGSYVGDGTAGADNKNQLELDMDPALVFIAAESYSEFGFLLHPSPFGLYLEDLLSDGLHVEWNEGEVVWYSSHYNNDSPSESHQRQLNRDGATYHYVAIGLGNTGLDFDRLDYLEQLQQEQEVTV